MYTVSSIPRQAVGYGSQVTVEGEDGNEEKYELVFPEEVDAAAGLISIGSPLGRAMLNKEVGDEIEVATPKGKRLYSILALRTIHDRQELAAP
jgi:transcription elongation factor GreA